MWIAYSYLAPLDLRLSHSFARTLLAMLQMFSQFVTWPWIMSVCSFEIVRAQATGPVWSFKNTLPLNKCRTKRFFISYSTWRTSRQSPGQSFELGVARGCLHHVVPASPWEPHVSIRSSREMASTFLLPPRSHLKAKTNRKRVSSPSSPTRKKVVRDRS